MAARVISPRPFARCARALPEARVEVLTPDFCGDLDAVARVLDAGPHVFNHNMETVPRLYRRVRPQADYRQSLDVLRFARQHRAGRPDEVGLHGGPGRDAPTKCTQLLRDLRAAGCRCRDDRPVSAADAPQSAGRRVRDAGAVRRVSRLRPVDRLQMVFSGPLVRSSYMADLVHERSFAARGSKYAPGAPLRRPADSDLSALQSDVWLAPVRADAAADRAARANRVRARRFLLGWAAAIVFWFGVCYWIQFVLEVHGGMGRWGGWGTFLLFAVLKACTWRVFAALAGFADAPLVRDARRGRAVDRHRSARTARWASRGWTWATPASTWRADAPRALHRRLRIVVRVRDDGARRWRLLIAAAAAAWSCSGCSLLLAAAGLAALPDRTRGRNTALLVQPNISETEEWTPVTAEMLHRRHA